MTLSTSGSRSRTIVEGLTGELSALRPHQARERLRFERQLAGEDLVQHQAERVDVALDGDFLARELLGRHVGRRAVAHFGAFDLARQSGQSEIGEQHLAAAVEHDVGRLQVAMQHALFVRGGESGAELARDLERLVAGQPADAPQQRAQVFAIHVFHREEVQPFDFAEVVDAADVGMRDLPGDADLVAESRRAPASFCVRPRAGT